MNHINFELKVYAMGQQFSNRTSIPAMTPVLTLRLPGYWKNSLVIIRLVLIPSLFVASGIFRRQPVYVPIPRDLGVRRTHRITSVLGSVGRAGPTQPGVMIMIRKRKDRRAFSIAFQCYLLPNFLIAGVIETQARTSFVAHSSYRTLAHTFYVCSWRLHNSSIAGLVRSPLVRLGPPTILISHHSI